MMRCRRLWVAVVIPLLFFVEFLKASEQKRLSGKWLRASQDLATRQGWAPESVYQPETQFGVATEAGGEESSWESEMEAASEASAPSAPPLLGRDGRGTRWSPTIQYPELDISPPYSVRDEFELKDPYSSPPPYQEAPDERPLVEVGRHEGKGGWGPQQKHGEPALRTLEALKLGHRGRRSSQAFPQPIVEGRTPTAEALAGRAITHGQTGLPEKGEKKFVHPAWLREAQSETASRSYKRKMEEEKARVEERRRREAVSRQAALGRRWESFFEERVAETQYAEEGSKFREKPLEGYSRQPVHRAEPTEESYGYPEVERKAVPAPQGEKSISGEDWSEEEEEVTSRFGRTSGPYSKGVCKSGETLQSEEAGEEAWSRAMAPAVPMIMALGQRLVELLRKVNNRTASVWDIRMVSGSVAQLVEQVEDIVNASSDSETKSLFREIRREFPEYKIRSGIELVGLLWMLTTQLRFATGEEVAVREPEVSELVGRAIAMLDAFGRRMSAGDPARDLVPIVINLIELLTPLSELFGVGTRELSGFVRTKVWNFLHDHVGMHLTAYYALQFPNGDEACQTIRKLGEIAELIRALVRTQYVQPMDEVYTFVDRWMSQEAERLLKSLEALLAKITEQQGQCFPALNEFDQNQYVRRRNFLGGLVTCCQQNGLPVTATAQWLAKLDEQWNTIQACYSSQSAIGAPPPYSTGRTGGGFSGDYGPATYQSTGATDYFRKAFDF